MQSATRSCPDQPCAIQVIRPTWNPGRFNAPKMAIRRHRLEGVIHHSEHGTQYMSIEFGRRCREAGNQPSMRSAGNRFDNTLCGGFFAMVDCAPLTFRNFAPGPRHN